MKIEKTSDRINVVHCRDCFWCYIKDMNIGECENRYGLIGVIKPGDFCSRGKRREQVLQQEG